MAQTTSDTPARHYTLPCAFCGRWNRIPAARAADRPKCGECAKPILLDRPFLLTADTFHRAIEETTVPVIVDFYADWCGPCKMMAPVLDEFAQQRMGQVFVAKLDTDRAPAISQLLGIRGIPTMIRFDAGKETRRQSGAMQLRQLAAFVDGTIG
jgi:thioredoxin 2